MRIAYILGSIPTQSETFIAEEIRQHLTAGIDVRIFTLLPPEKTIPKFVIDAGLIEIVTWLGINGNPWLRILSSGADAARAIATGKIRDVTEGLNFTRYGEMAKRLLVYNLIRSWRNTPNDYDLIHCHFGQIGLCASALKARSVTRAKLVTTFHGKDISQIVSEAGPNVYSNLFEHGNLFLPVSQYWANRLIKLGADPEKIVVHRLGVDGARLTFRPSHRPNSGPITLISVGRMVEKKGHEITLRAVSEARNERPDLDLRLDIVGDGPLLSSMQSLAGNLGIENVVRFLGGLEHEHALRLVDQAHVFVLASYTADDGDMEGIPVSIMEAQAMGLPVLSTRHSGIPELVEDTRTGYLSNERDVGGLAKNIIRLVEKSAQWEMMGRAGRKRVIEAFNNERQGEQLRSIYRTVIAAGTHNST